MPFNVKERNIMHYIKWFDLEKKARKQKVGLWKDENPIAPWEWRNGKSITN